MKKLALCVALALAAGGAYAKDWSTIRFGTDASYAPFESKATDGKLVGFDIDLGNEICRRLNAKCVWVEQDFDGMIPGLKAKKFDGALSALTITPQREQQIAFSAKLFNTPTRLVAKQGSPLQPTIASLQGKTVGVEQGSIQETYAKQNWAPKGINVIPYQNQDQVYLDLQSGRLDAALQDEVQANLGFLKTPRGAGFAFAGPQVVDAKVLGEGVGYGVRKNDAALKTALNGALKDLKADGTLDRIAAKYFDVKVVIK